jgi:hypothetical protein
MYDAALLTGLKYRNFHIAITTIRSMDMSVDHRTMRCARGTPAKNRCTAGEYQPVSGSQRPVPRSASPPGEYRFNSRFWWRGLSAAKWMLPR